MSKGLVLSIVVCAAFVIGGANATFAGEVTGSGKSLELPGGGLHGKSDCAYSGLEDWDDQTIQPVEPGVVQSFGKHPNGAFGTGVGDDPANNAPNNPGPAAPGVACNPSEPS